MIDFRSLKNSRTVTLLKTLTILKIILAVKILSVLNSVYPWQEKLFVLGRRFQDKILVFRIVKDFEYYKNPVALKILLFCIWFGRLSLKVSNWVSSLKLFSSRKLLNFKKQVQIFFTVTSWRCESSNLSLVVLDKLPFALSKPLFWRIRKSMKYQLTDWQTDGTYLLSLLTGDYSLVFPKA